jgi:hypothetical protein
MKSSNAEANWSLSACDGAVDHPCRYLAEMTYDFRVRAALGTTVKIESPQTELEIHESDQVRVIVRSFDGRTPLTDSREILIKGLGYATEEGARSEGERWRGHVMVGFARLGRGPTSVTADRPVG